MQLISHTLGDIIETTRSSPASYYDEAGILHYVSNDIPRIDHDPETGEVLGLLQELESTNLVSNSDQIDTWTGFWGIPNGTVNGEIDPMGGTRAISFPISGLVYGPSGRSGGYTTNSGAISQGDIITESVFIKVNNAPVTMWFGGGTSAVGTPVTITEANKWFRVSSSYTQQSFYRLTCLNFLRDYDPIPDDTRVYLFRGQAEISSYASSPIYTLGSTETRETDVYKYVLGHGYNQDAGTVLIKARANWVDSGGSSVFVGIGNSSGTAKGRLQFDQLPNGNVRFVISDDSSSFSPTTSIAGNSIGDWITIAASWDKTDGSVRFAVNGVSTTSSGVSFGTQDIIRLGGLDGYNTQNMNGHLKEFQYHPHSMSLSELESMSAP